MRRAFFFDQTKCMACNACSVACKDWKGVNPGEVRWRRVKTDESGTVVTEFKNLSMSCNHCEKPACKEACPVGAIYKRDDDGVVIVDRALCQGEQDCIAACPFGAVQIADDTQEPDKDSSWIPGTNHPAQKCDMCIDRLDQDKKPICVEACAAFALRIGEAASIPDGFEQITNTDFSYAYREDDPNLTTGPSFYIKKNDRKMAVK